MTRFLLVLFALVFGAAVFSVSARARAVEGITISGGDLPYPVRLTPSDEDAFKRRINSPPRLDNRPARAAGPTYSLTTAYWSEILARPNRPPIEESATYYAEGGIVLAKYGSEEAWLTLDIRQQGILERYIRLAGTRAIGQRPGVISLVTAAQREEDVAIEAGGKALVPEQAGAVWAALTTLGQPRFLETLAPPKALPNGLWLVFGLQEGRSLQLYYDPGAPGTLTDVLGGESYAVTPSLAAVLSTVRPAAVRLDEEATPGSKAWWLVMAAGGFVCLAVALWLTKHPVRLPFEPKG